MYESSTDREAIDPFHGNACSCRACSVLIEPDQAAYEELKQTRIEAALARLTQILSSGQWNSRPKMRSVVEVLEEILDQPNALRVFVKATYSDADGELVSTWVQDFLAQTHEIKVSNVTIGNVVREIQRVAQSTLARQNESLAEKTIDGQFKSI
ncbi:MAG: hypothetical protein KDA20_00255 [Phycisphaerales bacterium]|nr:hypothetical protein [Phycisphaerales bacterium]